MKLIENRVERCGYEDGKYGVEAKIALKKGGVLVVNMYGSNHWRDWIDDFIQLPARLVFRKPKTRITSPVYKNLKARRKWLNHAHKFIRYLESEIFPENNIVQLIFVGVSMGGSVSAICQQILIRKGWNTVVKMYGAPRCFNQRVTAPYSYRNRGDIVPYLPFWLKKLGTDRPSEKFHFLFWKAHEEYEKEDWL